MGKLTDVQVRSWVTANRPIAGKSDGDGLTFTLSKAGTAAWVLRYRFGNRQREMSLGRYPDISLKEARKLAAEARVKLMAGVDVGAEKRRVKAAHAAASTFAGLAEDYMKRAAPALSKTTQRETRRYLDKDILPRIGYLPIQDVTGAEIVQLIERIAERSETVARRTFEILSVIFAHGMAKHITTINPCAGLKLSAILGKPTQKRERIKLTADELRAALASLPRLGVENELAIKILLATCVRKGELIRAQRKHLDLEKALWTVPDEHSKSGKGFVIPLPHTVTGWFKALLAINGGSEYVLPSRRVGYASRNKPMCVNTLNAALNRLEGDFRRFTPHDLRSTARSYLSELGVDVIVAERCLNHTLGGLVAIYDQHDYLEERRAALERWAAYIENAELAREWNVTPLHAKSKKTALAGNQ